MVHLTAIIKFAIGEEENQCWGGGGIENVGCHMSGDFPTASNYAQGEKAPNLY